MLPIPKALKIDRDLEEERDLLEKSRAYLEAKERLGIHVSDLIDPRLACFKKLTGAGIPDRLINMFLVGQVAHAIIELVKGGSGDYTTADGGTKHAEDIFYSPDFMNYKGEPDEIKTTRSFYVPKQSYLPDDSTYHMYFEQLISYMALENKTVGRLTMLYLNSKDETGKTAPQFYIWRVETEPQALEAMRRVLFETKNALIAAVENKSPHSLPTCRAWKCGINCEFWDNCRPDGRYGVPKKEWDK